MALTPVEMLEQWEDGGAVWKVMAIGPEHVSIDLCACTGEPVDRLDSSDPQLLAWLRAQPERLRGNIE